MAQEAAQEAAIKVPWLKVQGLTKLKVQRLQPALEAAVEVPEEAKALEAAAQEATQKATQKAPAEANTQNPPPEAEATTKTPKTSWGNGRRKCQK